MTALPDHSGAFAARRSLPDVRRPKVSEYFWGLEVPSGDGGLSVALVMRLAAALMFALVVGVAVAVWAPPFAAFWQGVLAARIMMTVLLLLAGAGLARYASRGTKVYVQLDNTAGELREVVYTVFGTAVVLARYGVDAVQSVHIRRSSMKPSLGQIQIEVAGVGVLPAGFGDVSSLVSLRDRMRVEMGVCQNGVARPAVWSGPRVA